MKNKKITFALLALYILPWCIQYLVINFMSVYVASLPFATEKTVGEVVGLGAIVTCVSQAVWAWFADRAKNKSNVLCLSLVLLAAISILFLNESITKPMLFLSVILFYGCYMVHQPLIDSICSEVHQSTGLQFGFFRSFASLGFGLAGFALIVLPHDNPTIFFVYAAILAAASALVSKLIRAPRIEGDKEEKDKNVFNPTYVKFLIYTFILFVGCSGNTSFYSVYFTSPKGLGGDLGVLSLILGVGSIAEWLVVMAVSKFADKLSPRFAFGFIAFSGIFRSLVVYLAPNGGVASLAMVFSCIWYGFLWATASPFIKSIVPESGNVFAQGIWTVVSFGAGSFVGSYLSGVYAEAFGMRNLFLMLSVLMAVLMVITPLLIPKTNK